jgi:two-component system response regulator LytT
MNLLIIGNQRDIPEKIEYKISELDENVRVIGICRSVAESIHWLQNNTHPDLILMDIQLPDGFSYLIFKSYKITCPVIFFYSASDNISSDTFAYNGIDYLTKPINYNRLRRSICKYKNLQHHFIKNHSPLISYLNKEETYSLRILVKNGREYYAIMVNAIVYFFTKNKLIFLFDRKNRKYYAHERKLSVLEAKLNPRVFFRPSRKYIININYLKRFKAIDNGKISLEMICPTENEIFVSQERSTYFRKWIQSI